MLNTSTFSYATKEKYDLFEAQIKNSLKNWGVLDKFDVLEFQRQVDSIPHQAAFPNASFRAGIPQPNASSQLAATTYLRVFVQAVEKMTLFMFLKAVSTRLDYFGTLVS